jgi:hypothetical protein
VDDRGDLYTDRDEPVEENNAAFLALLRRGIPPDLEVHLPAADKWLGEHLHDFDIGPFRDFRRQVEKAAEDARQFARDNDPPEALVEEMKRKAAALQGSDFAVN